MRIETATAPGTPGAPNEDFVAAAMPAGGHGGALVLLDGVTPPPDNGNCVHSVAWFTARLGGKLLELSVSRPDLTLAECLSAAIGVTADAHRSTCDLSHPLTPQATVVTVRWDGRELEHLVLSDSALLLEDPEGQVTAVLDDRIDRLRAAGRRVAPLRNLPGGFFTAAADPSVSAKAVTGRTPLTALRAVAALSDGAARGVEVFGVDDWTATMSLLRKVGPEALLTRVRAAEDADPDGTAVPRGKPYDDATAVLLEL
jgi:hypothetical protein